MSSSNALNVFFSSQSCYPDYYDNPYSSRAAEEREEMTRNFLNAFKDEDCSDCEVVESSDDEVIKSSDSEVEASSDKEMQEQPLDIFEKPRIWPNCELGSRLKAMMEPFLSEHLSKIQKVAIDSSSTVHFGNKSPYRTPGLEKLASFQSPLSFRVTRLGDVWVLFKNRVSQDHTVRFCYSPTLGIYGIKKAIDVQRKEIYGFLSQLNQSIENSNKKSSIIPILDIALVPLKKFKNPDSEWDPSIEESDKYSMITPRFDYSMVDVAGADYNCIQHVKKFLTFLKISISLWTDLMKEHRIIHSEFNPGNIVFSYQNCVIVDAKLIDFDEFKSPLPSPVLYNGKRQAIGTILLSELDPSIGQSLKCGLDCVFSLARDCIDKTIILSEKKMKSYFFRESVELKNIARELISSLNILAFGPLYLTFENDSNWLMNKDLYLNDCLIEISVLEKKVCIEDVLERTDSLIQKIEKLIKIN